MATLFLSGFVHPDKRRGASVWLCRPCARGALVWFQSSPFCRFTNGVAGAMYHFCITLEFENGTSCASSSSLEAQPPLLAYPH
jgi:hypothetical protein